jgi:fatty-acyl-CoA synthase
VHDRYYFFDRAFAGFQFSNMEKTMTHFVKKTIGRVLKETAEKFSKNEALVYPPYGLRLNYREFTEECIKVAKGFMALGVAKGDKVSVWTNNIPEWTYMQFGLGMIGAVLVTINTNYKSHELEYILKQSDSTTLVIIDEFKDTNYYEVVKDILPETESCDPGDIQCQRLPLLKNIIYIGKKQNTPGIYKFNDIVKLGEKVLPGELESREKSLYPDDVINMQYTSGTTGFPKGVMLTHYNIVNNARMVGDVMALTERDKLLIQVPLFHCFGCVMSTLNSVYHGSTMVLIDFDPTLALTTIHAEHCTAINGVPTMFISILNHQDFNKDGMTSLRTGIMAGAPCPVEAMNQVRDKMNCGEIVIAFGQTESSPVMTMTRRDDPVELRVSTVGTLLPDIEGKIIDPETGSEQPFDTQGEIVTRSECVMKGYYKMESATVQAIDRDGWLHTGDLGTIDKNGYFKVTGRIKDMIIRGGENIYPREVEEFLYKNPKVLDVQVIGLPDRKYGEVVLAVIKLKNGGTVNPEELVEFCTGKIARHKIPKYWEFVPEFPMTASGKIQKFKLREMFEEKYIN